ncbi:MAG: FecR domain-containing protein [bacterium]
MKTSCRQTSTLLRTPLGDLTPAFRAHMQDCDVCQSTYTELLSISKSASDLPTPKWSPARKQSVRDALLASAHATPSPPSRPWRVWVAAAVVLLGLGAMFLTTRHEEPVATAQAVMRGTVHPSPGARYTRIGSSPDEIVRLYQGHITVEVQKLQRGERFRVITGDGEVEVRGTAFEVTANEDRMTAVRVLHGRVEVRTAAQDVVVLGASQRWESPNEPPTKTPVQVVPTVVEQPPAVIEEPARVHPKTNPRPKPNNPAPTTPSEAELRYQEGWAAMRESEFSRAASAFEAVIADPTSALVQDASYWRAVALGRAGRKSEASKALGSFIQTFPDSPKVAEAQAMLGWIHLENHDSAAARKAFEAAASSNVDAAKKSATRGLENLNATAP